MLYVQFVHALKIHTIVIIIIIIIVLERRTPVSPWPASVDDVSSLDLLVIVDI